VIPEVDWIIRYDTVLRPDVVVTCNIPELQSHLKRNPEVVFEVISPSTDRKDENLKYEIYCREKVSYYVLVYPEFKKVRVYKLVNGNYEMAFDGVSGEFELKFNNCKILLKAREIFDNI
jgi:Uma2 family endonuclease